jgi:Fic family protein
MIGASTRIENAQLTDTEINWIDTILTLDSHVTAFESHRHRIEDKLSKDRERSIEEVAGCRLMLHTIYEQSKEFLPLTESTLRGLHAELMRYYRHAGPITSAAMSNLLSFYNDALWQEQWTIAVATEFVFRFLAIHPFQDGNGRVGRGLFLLSLLQSPHEIISKTAPYLAIDRQIEKHKAQYYSVLNKCSNGVFQSDPSKYHIEYFLEFMVRILEDALDDVEYYRLRHQKITELSDAATRVLECFKEFPEVRLTTKDIIEATAIARRTVVNALNALLDAGLIQKYGKGAGTRYQLLF